MKEGFPRHAKPEQEGQKPERINWNEELRLSFLFSQGDAKLQEDIFVYLANIAYEHESPESEEFKKGMLSVHVRDMTAHGAHKSISFPESGVYLEEDRQRNRLIEAFARRYSRLSEDERSKIKRWVTYGLINRDNAMIQRRKLVLSERGERDTHSSFFLDFGVLQTGTPPWSYDALPQSYKRMWSDAVETAKETGKNRGSEMFSIVSAYMESHPNLSEEGMQRIRDFVGIEPPPETKDGP